MKKTKTKEERFEKVVKVEDKSLIWYGLFNYLAVLILLLLEHSFFSGILLGMSFVLGNMFLVVYFSGENRKVYWRKIK